MSILKSLGLILFGLLGVGFASPGAYAHAVYLKAIKEFYPQSAGSFRCASCHVTPKSLNRYGKAVELAAQGSPTSQDVQMILESANAKEVSEFGVTRREVPYSPDRMKSAFAIADKIDLAGFGVAAGQRIQNKLPPVMAYPKKAARISEAEMACFRGVQKQGSILSKGILSCEESPIFQDETLVFGSFQEKNPSLFIYPKNGVPFEVRSTEYATQGNLLAVTEEGGKTYYVRLEGAEKAPVFIAPSEAEKKKFVVVKGKATEGDRAFQLFAYRVEQKMDELLEKFKWDVESYEPNWEFGPAPQTESYVRSLSSCLATKYEVKAKSVTEEIQKITNKWNAVSQGSSTGQGASPSGDAKPAQ